jgi:ribosomal protein L37E
LFVKNSGATFYKPVISDRMVKMETRGRELKSTIRPCRECGKDISEQAVTCPHCGAPYPAKEKWDGWGFEYKSEATMFGLPLIHISFKYRMNRTPVVAKGIVAIGQFACGVFTLSQFGIGVFSLSQFTIAAYAIAQFALAYSLTAQFGIFLESGRGQMVRSLTELLAMFQ